MGYNTTVVVLNDAIGDIENDPEFGKKLAQAIKAFRPHVSNYVSAGCHVNAAQVIESHHSSCDVIVSVGGNTGTVLDKNAIQNGFVGRK